jgi:hypothetical protein
MEFQIKSNYNNAVRITGLENRIPIAASTNMHATNKGLEPGNHPIHLRAHYKQIVFLQSFSHSHLHRSIIVI